MLKDVGMDVKVNAYDRATHFSKLRLGINFVTFKYLLAQPLRRLRGADVVDGDPHPELGRTRSCRRSMRHMRRISRRRRRQQLLAASHKGQMVGARRLHCGPRIRRRTSG